MRCPPYLCSKSKLVEDRVCLEEPADRAFLDVANPSLVADTAALVAFMHAELRPLVEYTAFALPRNWTHTFRNIYSIGCSFPLNIWLPDRIKGAAISALKTGRFEAREEGYTSSEPTAVKTSSIFDMSFNSRVEATRNRILGAKLRLRLAFHDQAVLQKAREVFDLLQAALPTQYHGYYHSSGRMTEADAVSAAYLAILLHDGLQQKPLKHYLECRYPRLVAHTDIVSPALLVNLPIDTRH